MAYNTIQVEVSEDNALTLQEFADKCKELYGWKTVEVRNGDIVFTDEGGTEKMMDTEGGVYTLDKDGEQGDLLDAHALAEDFDWTQHLWVADGEGNPIVIFQH